MKTLKYKSTSKLRKNGNSFYAKLDKDFVTNNNLQIGQIITIEISVQETTSFINCPHCNFEFITSNFDIRKECPRCNHIFEVKGG